MGAAAPNSARAIPALLQYLATVLVQDACDLLSSQDDDVKAAAEANPVHKFLLSKPEFRCTI